MIKTIDDLAARMVEADPCMMPGGNSSEEGDPVELLSHAERKAMIDHLLKEHPRPMMFSLPIRKRVRALKKLQSDFVKSEAKFFREVHVLECKFEKKMSALAERRRQIVNGLCEPTDEEVNAYPETDVLLGWEIDPKDLERSDIKGIPYFWFAVLRSIPLMADVISKQDEPILMSLTDIRSILLKEPMSFRLEFEFAPNEYFKNKFLYKHYYLKCEPTTESPFEFEGSEIYKCDACKIDWKPGKNVTQKTVVKKQRHKSEGDVRTVTQVVQARSFFNFFHTPKVDADKNALDKGHMHDFEMATYLRERVIPRAILYFTGEAFAGDSSEITMDEESEIGDDIKSSATESQEGKEGGERSTATEESS